MLSVNQVELYDRDSLVSNLLSDHSSIAISDPASSIKSTKEANALKYTVKRELERRAEKHLVDDQVKVQQMINLYETNFVTQSRSKKRLINLDWVPIITPKSIVAWKILIACLIIFVFFEIPIYVTYGSEFWNGIFASSDRDILFYVMGMLFVIDMGLDFFTAFYKHGNLVTDRMLIAKHYFYGYFAYDCIAIISGMVRLSFLTDNFRWVFLLFYFKCPSLLRIDRQIGEVILLHKTLRTSYEVSKMLIFMFFCFNIFACIFYRVGIFSVNSNLQSWLDNPGCNFGQINELPIQQQYFFSLYFALGTISTTMGYGDITPMNIYECGTCLFAIMFAIMVFAYNINNFQRLMDEYRANQSVLFNRKICINKFMEIKNVPSDFRERIRQYLNEYWYQEQQRDLDTESIVFNSLAPELKQDLFYYSYGQFLQSTFFGQQFSKPCLKEISARVREVSYSSKDILIYDKSTEQTDDYSFYFIIDGEIQMRPGGNELLRKVLTNGDYFGEWSFLTGFPRTATAMAQVYTQLYKLTRADFLETLKKFPHDYEQYCQLRDKLLFSQSYDEVDQLCWTCHAFDHLSSDCPITHYKPPVQELIENDTVLDTVQGRMNIRRIDRKKWDTRVNSKQLVKGLSKNKKLQKQVSLMLKTQKALLKPKKVNFVAESGPLQSQEAIKQSTKIMKRIDSQEIIKESKHEESPGESPQKQMKNSEFGNGMDQSANLMTQSQRPDRRFEQYRMKLESHRIHMGMDRFDAPANFKRYYPNFNSQNYEVFKGMDIAKEEDINNIRKSLAVPST